MATTEVTVTGTPTAISGLDAAGIYIATNVGGGNMRYRWAAIGADAPDSEAYGMPLLVGDQFPIVGRASESLYVWMTDDNAAGQLVIDQVP